MLSNLKQRVSCLEYLKSTAVKDTVVFVNDRNNIEKYHNKPFIVIVDDLRPDKEALVTD